MLDPFHADAHPLIRVWRARLYVNLVKIEASPPNLRRRMVYQYWFYIWDRSEFEC